MKFFHFSDLTGARTGDWGKIIEGFVCFLTYCFLDKSDGDGKSHVIGIVKQIFQPEEILVTNTGGVLVVPECF